MKYKGIIFDLDGVICSTDEYHYQAWKQLADKLEIPFDRTINDRLRGVSRMESLEIILEKSGDKAFTPEEKIELAEQKNTNYRASLLLMNTKDLEDEVKDTLNKLREKGIKLAIGSSSKNARLILNQIGLSDFFDAISDGNNITKSKPDPEVFYKAAEYISEKPKDCLVIEDAVAGIDAAVSGEFDCAGIGSASDYKQTTYSLKSFSDILKII